MTTRPGQTGHREPGQATESLTERLHILTDALRAHLSTLENDSSDGDASTAYESAARAFDTYEELLFVETDEVTPLELA